YPELSAQQVKFIIENSVVKPTANVKNPQTKEMVPMNVLSKTGGIVNAYEAVKLAEQMETDRLRPGFNN
ncbi:MAG: peptidase S8, partial [Bacteroidetes bacterium]|nr:peptidase S8 [Bacteroidota bacterium]